MYRDHGRRWWRTEFADVDGCATEWHSQKDSPLSSGGDWDENPSSHRLSSEVVQQQDAPKSWNTRIKTMLSFTRHHQSRHRHRRVITVTLQYNAVNTYNHGWSAAGHLIFDPPIVCWRAALSSSTSRRVLSVSDTRKVDCTTRFYCSQLRRICTAHFVQVILFYDHAT